MSPLRRVAAASLLLEPRPRASAGLDDPRDAGGPLGGPLDKEANRARPSLESENPPGAAATGPLAGCVNPRISLRGTDRFVVCVWHRAAALLSLPMPSLETLPPVSLGAVFDELYLEETLPLEAGPHLRASPPTPWPPEALLTLSPYPVSSLLLLPPPPPRLPSKALPLPFPARVLSLRESRVDEWRPPTTESSGDCRRREGGRIFTGSAGLGSRGRPSSVTRAPSRRGPAAVRFLSSTLNMIRRTRGGGWVTRVSGRRGSGVCGERSVGVRGRFERVGSRIVHRLAL